MNIKAALAVTRFGLGARPGEISTARPDPHGWLKQQLKRDAVAGFNEANLFSSKHHFETFFNARIVERRARRSSDTPQVNREAAMAFARHVRATIIAEVSARLALGSQTTAPFHERLTRFWANHFTVSGLKFQTAAVAGAYEREAIRPNILGSFADLADAAIFHPAMLVYLDNWQSVGPGSRAGRRRDLGLNENLAREVLELHTVSPAAGYTQEDVTEFARALTGWTIGNPRIGSNRPGETLFLEPTHEPGRRTVLNNRYNDTGQDQARTIVRDLSRHPATASHIATKLARHFVSDEPAQPIIDRLAATFLETGGDLKALYTTLVDSPQAWLLEQKKVKSPDELLTSSSRMLGLQAVFAGKPREVLESLAQRPFAAPSPEGWPDIADAWIGPDSLSKRIEWASQVSLRRSGIDARAFLVEALGDLATQETRRAVARAESGAQALTLALMSPQFQRR